MHYALLGIGIFLLLTGMVASFYYESEILWFETRKVYPYQNTGIALILAGASSMALGVFYSPLKQRVTEESI